MVEEVDTKPSGRVWVSATKTAVRIDRFGERMEAGQVYLPAVREKMPKGAFAWTEGGSTWISVYSDAQRSYGVLISRITQRLLGVQQGSSHGLQDVARNMQKEGGEQRNQ